jgi:hypothetical protein
LQTLAVLHESGWQRPISQPRLYCAPTEQYLALEFRDATDYQTRILIVNHGACGAHIARQMVAFGYGQRNGLATRGTEFHGSIRSSQLPKVWVFIGP